VLLEPEVLPALLALLPSQGAALVLSLAPQGTALVLLLAPQGAALVLSLVVAVLVQKHLHEQLLETSEQQPTIAGEQPCAARTNSFPSRRPCQCF
jgi:hypothetical protein